MAGRVSITAAIWLSTSFWSSVQLSVGTPLGARERASAVYIYFPGTCTIEKANLINLRRNRNTRGGRSSRCFELKSGTSGLWSVSITICLPKICSENFSQAQVIANASFSIWAYRFPVSLNEQEVYITGFHPSWCA